MHFFDLHCDTAYRCYTENLPLSDKSLAFSISAVDKFQSYRQCFAVFIRDDCRAPFDFYKAVLKDIKEKLKIKPISLIPYFTLEGASLIDSKEKVYELYLDDIRAITLTWNGENKIAGGVNSDKGLTQFGREIIGTLNSLKIFTDLSHLNKKSFYGAIECAEFPFASHSNCFSIKQNKRNLSDEQIRLIAEKGGIIGLCFYPDFLEGDVFLSLYENICHLLYMGLENNIAIGSDFDGGAMDKKLSTSADIFALWRYLECKGIEKEILYKIFYKNALNFFDKRA